MQVSRLVNVAAVLLAFCALKPLGAQSRSPAEPGDIAHIEGIVSLDGHGIDPQATPLFLRDNSVVRTNEGRADVLVAKGIALRLGEQSSFRMIRHRLGDVRIEIFGGTAFVIATSVPKDPSVTIACEDVVTPSEAGIYRFDAYPAWARGDEVCRLKVYKGAADVRLATVNGLLKRGETINLSRECGDMIPTFPFNVDDADGLNESTGAFRSGWIPEKPARR